MLLEIAHQHDSISVISMNSVLLPLILSSLIFRAGDWAALKTQWSSWTEQRESKEDSDHMVRWMCTYSVRSAYV